MATINASSLKNKFKNYAGSESFRKSLNSKVFDSDEDYLEEVMGKLCKCYENALNDSGISKDARIAIGDLYTSIASRKNSKGEYVIYGSIDQNARSSLTPNKWPDGVDDMAALFNNGYSTHILSDSEEGEEPVHAQVRGYWHGHLTWSLPVREGLHFVQQCISDFNGNYGTDYNAIARLIQNGRFT